MTQLVGIDLGTRKAALAMFSLRADDVLDIRYTVSLFVHPANRGKELSELTSLVSRAVGHVEYAFIEEPLLGRGVKASMQIAQTAGAIMANLTAKGIHTELVNVKTWKKDVVENGNANKKMVEMMLNERFPQYAAECGEDGDQRDACCVGIWGADVIRRTRGSILADWLEPTR